MSNHQSNRAFHAPVWISILGSLFSPSVHTAARLHVAGAHQSGAGALPSALFAAAATAWLRASTGWGLHPLLALLIVALAGALSGGFVGGKRDVHLQIAPQSRRRLIISDAKMAEWPVRTRERFGRPNTGRCTSSSAGQDDGLPLLLLHALGVSSWSWIYGNVAGLSQTYRTYAIDLIGDVGKSRFTDSNHTGEDIAERSERSSTPRSPTSWASTKRTSSARRMAARLRQLTPALQPERSEKMVLLVAPMGMRGRRRRSCASCWPSLFPAQAGSGPAPSAGPSATAQRCKPTTGNGSGWS